MIYLHSQMVAKKVLFSGTVNGKFKQLYKRMAAVNKSNGPFDVLLCIGNPLPEAGKSRSRVEISFVLNKLGRHRWLNLNVSDF